MQTLQTKARIANTDVTTAICQFSIRVRPIVAAVATIASKIYSDRPLEFITKAWQSSSNKINAVYEVIVVWALITLLKTKVLSSLTE